MLQIEHPKDSPEVVNLVCPIYLILQLLSLVDYAATCNKTYGDDLEAVLLGFRVYSKGSAPVQISSQLANGTTVSWKKNWSFSE
jgi:hypothetical protein